MTGDGLTDAFDGRQFTWNVVAVDVSRSSPDPSGEGGSLPGY